MAVRRHKILLVLLLIGSGIGAQAEEQKATFAGGCFWCMEPPYDKLPGVISTVSGYAGGHVENPTYDQVTSGRTGHQEVVQVTYDDGEVSYGKLLEVFWVNVDPFDDRGQFCDKGSQYLSGIFYHNEQQQQQAEASKQKIAKTLQPNEPSPLLSSPWKHFTPPRSITRTTTRRTDCAITSTARAAGAMRG